MIEYTTGGWMPPQSPSASWRRTIHCSARRSADRRSRPGGGGTRRAVARSGAGPDRERNNRPLVERRPTSGSGRRVRAELGRCGRPQLVEGERQRPGRPVGHHDGQGHHGLASPTPEVVDVQRRPGRQEHDLGRHHRQVLPVPPAQQASQMRVNTRLPSIPPWLRTQAAAAGSGGESAGVAGEAQGHVGLDGGRQIGRPAVEGAPRPVVMLVGPDPPGRRRRPGRRPGCRGSGAA